MYWPLGAPRVYAASRRRRKGNISDQEDENVTANEDATSSDILGLQVARNGHLFVTITDIGLTVWQTAVCQGRNVLDWF